MDDDQQFCLRWNNHQSTLISVFDTLLEKGIHVDCTLAAEGQTLKAHKVVLSACSPYFESVLSQQYDKHPIIILKDVKFAELRAMMDYMYRGEVNISQDQLGALLKAAESLQIKGLSDSKPPPPPSHPPHPRSVTPPPKVRSVRASPGGEIEEGSREGSISPSRRKRKKRRTSLSPLPSHQLSHPVAHPLPIPPVAPINHTPVTLPHSNHSPQPVLNNTAQVTLATGALPSPVAVPPIVDSINDENDTMAKIKRIQFNNEPVAKLKPESDVDIPAVVRPKAEYSDDGIEDSVEDLTLDEEAESDADGDMEHSGYPWQMDRSQDESIPGQDGHRDSQESRVTRSSSKPTNSKNDYGAMDLDSEASLGTDSGEPVDVHLPDDAQLVRQARLLRENFLQNNNVIAKLDPDSKVVQKAEADSDTEYDDTDEILLPDESEVFGDAAIKMEDMKDVKFLRSGRLSALDDPARHFECRHCSKRYRWKSTLRRHESVECGGKPPAHACPYCPYRAKQRGNLGVHVRKHHNAEWMRFADTKLRKTKKANHSM